MLIKEVISTAQFLRVNLSSEINSMPICARGLNSLTAAGLQMATRRNRVSLRVRQSIRTYKNTKN